MEIMKVTTALTALLGFITALILSGCSLKLNADGSKEATLDGQGVVQVFDTLK